MEAYKDLKQHHTNKVLRVPLRPSESGPVTTMLTTLECLLGSTGEVQIAQQVSAAHAPLPLTPSLAK